MGPVTEKELRNAFLAYRVAYAHAGLTTTIWVDNQFGYYETTALDLVLTMPSEYQGGQISVAPYHNPVHPQRWSGASSCSSPAGIRFLGDSRREALAALRAATTTLYAAMEVLGQNAVERHVEAWHYLASQEAL